MRWIKHLWHRVHNAFTGEYHPYNQCHKMKLVKGGYVCCRLIKHHSGECNFYGAN